MGIMTNLKSLLNDFRFLLLYLGVFIILLYFSNIENTFSAILKIDFYTLLLILIILFFIFVLNCLNLYIFWKDNISLSFFDFFFQFLKSLILGKFLPFKFGDYSLVIILNESPNLTNLDGKGAAIISVDKLVSLSVNVLIFIYFGILTLKLFDLMLILYFSIILIILFYLIFSKKTLEILSNIFKSFTNFFINFYSQIEYLIKFKKFELLLNIILTFLRLFLQALIIFLVVNSIGGGINIESALFVSSVGQLINLIAITPSGVGFKEPLILFSLNFFINNYDISLASIIVLQAIDWISIILIFIFIFMKELKVDFFKK